MNLVTVSGGLLLLAAVVPLAPRPPAAAGLAPLAVHVTPAGEFLTVSLPSERTLRVSTERDGAPAQRDLELNSLPEGARIVAVRLGTYGDKGLAVLLAVESGAEVEYRFLKTAGDPLLSELVQGDPWASQGNGPRDPWSLSEALFTSTGAPYRLVDIHNPGGDSLEMTFRRGDMQGVREGAGARLGIDERIIHDTCPMSGKLAAGRSVSALVESIVRSP